MKVLLINGPNLNTLGRREPEIYGHDTLFDIVTRVEKRAIELGVEIVPFQSNHEGAIIDFLQEQKADASGIIMNFGAFTHYSYALRDAVSDSALPAVEVHISNVYAREEFRHRSVTASVAKGMITGLGWRGYIFALEYLASLAGQKK